MLAGIIRFELDGNGYGIPLADSREVLRLPFIAPLPRAPGVIAGAVNVRGSVIPVLDMRARFGLPPKAPHPADHLLVAAAHGRTVALHVDRVLGIAEIEADDVVEGRAVSPGAEYIAGVAKLPDGLVMIHDLGTFLTTAEAEGLDQALDAAAEGEG